MADIKICIATPAYGEMFYATYVQSLFSLLHTFEHKGWDSLFFTISYADITESRNFLLTHWYDKTDASHILFIDADMGYDPKLITDMLAFDRPVVGVVYPKRHIDVKRVVELATKGEQVDRAIARARDFVVRRRRGVMRPRVIKGFMQVDGCGAGVLLVKRACIAELLKKAPKLSKGTGTSPSPVTARLDRLIRAFDPMIVNGERLSEDYSFCHRWQALCRGEVWANIAHPVVHVGLQRFSARYADAMPSGPRMTLDTTTRWKLAKR